MLYANHTINKQYRKYTNKQLQALWAEAIGKPIRARYLLSSSVKVIKGEKVGYLTGICYMTPALKIAGINSCSHAILGGCWDNCLVHSGQMSSNVGIEARIDRLMLLIKNPALFFEILRREVIRLKRRARKFGYKTALRLNGTTDLDWTRILFEGRSIFKHFKGLRCYDYTKNPNLAKNYKAEGVHITFSFYKKARPDQLEDLLRAGVNVAIAYRDRVPEFQIINSQAWPVLNGDDHDLRFLDRPGYIVGLKFKFATFSKDAAEKNRRALESGFIIRSTDQI